MEIPLEVLVAENAALVAALGALWRAWAASRQETKEANERWAKEVRRGPELVMASPPGHGTAPESVPPPDWEENTAVRNLRHEIETAALDELRHRSLPASAGRYSHKFPPKRGGGGE